MTDYYALETKIEEMIDELQGLCSQNGLSNTAAEEEIVTSVFLYKFLNDKFMYNIKQFADELGVSVDEVLRNEDDELDAFYDQHPRDVMLRMEDTIETLSNRVNQDDFPQQFDAALERISGYEENDKFKVETADGEKKPLFTSLTDKVEKSKRQSFAKTVFSIITKDKFDFSEAYENNFDFYGSIFEHLIANYNVAKGRYAEYFTPQAVSSIIAYILVRMSKPDPDKLYEVYDAAAGSGSLVLHLANELGEGKFGNRARVYTQDISQKSSRFLRINMMLNGLTESLDNIIEGDTLLTPAHYNVAHDASSGHKKFDYITINPPFNMDFSSTRNDIESNWSDTNRFFAGVPNIPNKKLDGMEIFLLFFQHILWSLKDDGKAAVVVPTGFLTKGGIHSKIRQEIVDNNWLQGVISMPSNIFANTGTNVSVVFVDKAKKNDEIVLIDASKLGEKRKEGKNQRTVLRSSEIEDIETTFVNREKKQDFSVVVSCEEIQQKNYSLSAGQYFEVIIEYKDLTQEEFDAELQSRLDTLSALFDEGQELQVQLKARLKEVCLG